MSDIPLSFISEILFLKSIVDNSFPAMSNANIYAFFDNDSILEIILLLSCLIEFLIFESFSTFETTSSTSIIFKLQNLDNLFLYSLIASFIKLSLIFPTAIISTLILIIIFYLSMTTLLLIYESNL